MKKILMLLAMVMMFPLRTNAAEIEIPLSECIPLEDIACWQMDAYGYPCFSLKDVCNQLDDPANIGYAKIMDKVAAATTEICGYEMYSNCGFVTETADGLITVEDADGNIWQFMGMSDWAVGDLCSMIMSDEGTIEVYDDVILSYENHGGFWNE